MHMSTNCKCEYNIQDGIIYVPFILIKTRFVLDRNPGIGILVYIIIIVNNIVQTLCNIKAKQPESGDLCGNITEFRMAEGSPEPAGWRWSFCHPKRSDIAIQYARLMLFCFYILLFNGFKSFQAKIYEINMYLLLYFIFLNHSVGIHPTATQKSHEQHSNAIYVMSWWFMMS